MASRKSAHVVVRRQADGGADPNRCVGEITADVRVFFPPSATPEDVENTLLEATAKAWIQMQGDLNHDQE